MVARNPLTARHYPTLKQGRLAPRGDQVDPELVSIRIASNRSGGKVLAEDDSQAPDSLAAWYDEQGLWKKGMPEELPADVILGTEWVAAHATRQIPRDVADLLGIRGQTVVVTPHTHNVMPPRAKHDNARPYFEHLSEVLDN